MPTHPDREEASAAMMAYFVLGVFFLLFATIGLWAIFDKMVVFQTDMITLTNSTMPVSAERITTTNFLIQAQYALPILGIVLPLLFFAVIMSWRKGSGGVE
jgi:hypothetical protein